MMGETEKMPYDKQTYTYNSSLGPMPVEFYYYPEQPPDPNQLSTVVQAIATFSAPETYGEYPFATETGALAEPFPAGDAVK